MFNPYSPYNYTTLAVNSIEEAQAAPVDYSGNPVFYYNRTANEIYMKRFDLIGSGKVFFAKYVFEEMPESVEQKDEIKELKAQIAGLYELLTPAKKSENTEIGIGANKKAKKEAKDDE